MVFPNKEKYKDGDEHRRKCKPNPTPGKECRYERSYQSYGDTSTEKRKNKRAKATHRGVLQYLEEIN